MPAVLAHCRPRSNRLQWVRRPRTPVMRHARRDVAPPLKTLQWVRRPRTPVMRPMLIQGFRRRLRFNGSGVRERRLCRKATRHREFQVRASMGPASENAGYARGTLHRSALTGCCFNGSGVRERRLCVTTGEFHLTQRPLQWVRRPRTPVMRRQRILRVRPGSVSMGPASRTPVMPSTPLAADPPETRFNGSGVRERRLCR